MGVFEDCHAINDLLSENKTSEARDQLIKLLDFHKTNEIEYTPIVNHLIRETGLYPYLRPETSTWQDRLVHDVFKVDIGMEEPVTLHREQSSLLKKLIDGESVAISAPTSFGKSFVIDAFISINKPSNVAIIVPTIALTDETRRRLYNKFAHEYKIITTSEVPLAEKNIFIFPQERAINYINTIESLDMLVIDEFYKASPDFEKERSPALLKAIMRLGEKAKQKYFLAPNISTLNDNPFTKGIAFHKLDFNTVFLEKKELYHEIAGDELLKGEKLLEIIRAKPTKTLIYAGTYTEIDKVRNLLLENSDDVNSSLLNGFSDWLQTHYEANWSFAHLIKRGTGIHNGRMHRSLSQIQVRLFDDDNGISNLISTSSIIEGVNTSAENVVIWRNRNGGSRLNDFTYRNIIGRGGRMFQHFIGRIYILDEPPADENTQLTLSFPDELIGDVDETEFKAELSDEQVAKIISYKEEMSQILGEDVFLRLQKENVFHIANAALIKSIALDMKMNSGEWNGLAYLNSDDPQRWERFLYKMINLQPGGWDARYSDFVAFVKALKRNWTDTIPNIVRSLHQSNIGVEQFFQLERTATFKLSAIAHDVNVLQREILSEMETDISPFIARLSHAFLPSVVYQLEEYGLPRMISKKIHRSGLINFTDDELTLHQCVGAFQQIGIEQIKEGTIGLDTFDEYILDYFYDGIRMKNENNERPT